MAAALFPSLRKTLRPSNKAIIPAEVKWAGGSYFGDLQNSLTTATGKKWSLDLAMREGYERIVWVFKPVNVIATNASARKFTLTQGAALVDDHPLLKLLNKRANPLETGKQFRKRLSAQILLSKPGAFVEVTKSRGGTPLRLDLLPPHRVRIVPGDPHADPSDIKSLVDHYELVERDGIRSRSIEPEDMRWFRDPHPIDPYSGTTPLESAGLSIELDHFARLYNVMFMRNDGRPGGVVAVHGDLDEGEQRVIERKFDKGPAAAGKLTVVSAEGLSFIDPGGKPRDMSYAQLAKNAKIELLSSFGVSESMMGYSGDKTFANAEQERLGFWMDTMPPHMDVLVDGFNEDSDDELEGGFDLSDVEVLVAAAAAKLARAAAEVAAGLRSPFSYGQLAGNTEIEDIPQTRALYIPSGKVALPANAKDAIAMGMGPAQTAPAAGGSAGGDLGLDLGQGAGPGAADVAAGDGSGGGSPEGATGSGPAGPATQAIGAGQASAPAAVRAAAQRPVGRAAAALAAAQQTSPGAPQQKALPQATRRPGRVVLHVVGGKSEDAVSSDDADEDARDALEAAVSQVLTELGNELVERAVARMSSVKSRKGTRHWNPQGDREVDTRVQTKAIDPTYAVDEQQWQQQAEEQTSPLLIAAALVAAELTWHNLGGLGALPGRVIDQVTAGAREVASFIGHAAVRMADRLSATINGADQAGQSMPEMVAAVTGFKDRVTGWAQAISIQAGTATTEQARAAGAAAVEGGDEGTQPDEGTGPGQLETVATPPHTVDMYWRTRGDDRVRPTHASADGQKQPAGGVFEVGGYLMRWPGDPLAPPSETRNCRCHTQYRARRSGRFVPRPIPAPMEAAQ